MDNGLLLWSVTLVIALADELYFTINKSTSVYDQ